MTNRDITIGVILIAVGVVMLLSNLGIITAWREIWRDWWPLLLVIIGAVMLLKKPS